MTKLEKAGMQYSHNNTDEDESGVSIRLREAFISGAEWHASQSPWISVEERLPETNNGQSLCEVLVKTCDGRYSVTANVSVEDMAERGDITHWCAIPE